MGTNQFQREYIEYLEERNKELLNKLNNIKSNYESKILAKDLNKHYLISALGDMLNVCTAMPQEIDIFCDKMTAAMGAFKNILLRKSEMVHLVEKISKFINPIDNLNNDLISVDDSGLVKEQISESRASRKAGTVKVSPMINGHIISTEPRIYLSRVPGVFSPRSKNGGHGLSPIIEESPDTSPEPSNSGGHVFREVIIPVERINLSKMSYNYMSEESPKSRFKGPKSWKKSLSSNKRLSDHRKNIVFLENEENLNKKFSTGEDESPRLSENIDPLEGPSWLYKEIPDMNSASNHFVDYRRRKHRFATVFDKNDDCVDYFEKTNKSLEIDPRKFYESHEDGDDERDLEESERRASDGSEDLIHESFTKGSADSPKRRKCQTSRRKRSKDSNLKKDSESEKEKNSGIYSTSVEFYTPTQYDSSDNESDEKSTAELKNRRHEVLSSIEKTPNTPERVKEEIVRTCSGKKKRKKETSVKDPTENNVFVKLENCLPAKGFETKKSKGMSLNAEEKPRRSTSQTKSKSPVASSPETEGRKRRKAAPSFKLVELDLKRKLRRS